MRRSTECAWGAGSFLSFLFVLAACAAPAPSFTSGGDMQSAQILAMLNHYVLVSCVGNPARK